MAHNFYDRSPMWPEFNHGCPRPVPDDAEPYNTPYAVLGYTEAGEPVFTVHTVDGETYDVEAGNNIIVLKDTTYTLSLSDDEAEIILTGSDGATYEVPVQSAAEATSTTAGLMSAGDKAKLDTLQNYSTATVESAGLMSAADKAKLNNIASGAQVNPGVATTESNGLMSSADKVKLDNLSAGAQVNVIEAITVNGETVPIENKTAAITVSASGGSANGIETIKVNNVTQTVENKTVNIQVPTQTSQLENNSNYVTTQAMTEAIAAGTGKITKTLHYIETMEYNNGYARKTRDITAETLGVVNVKTDAAYSAIIAIEATSRAGLNVMHGLTILDTSTLRVWVEDDDAVGAYTIHIYVFVSTIDSTVDNT